MLPDSEWTPLNSNDKRHAHSDFFRTNLYYSSLHIKYPILPKKDKLHWKQQIIDKIFVRMHVTNPYLHTVWNTPNFFWGSFTELGGCTDLHFIYLIH